DVFTPDLDTFTAHGKNGMSFLFRISKLRIELSFVKSTLAVEVTAKHFIWSKAVVTFSLNQEDGHICFLERRLQSFLCFHVLPCHGSRCERNISTNTQVLFSSQDCLNSSVRCSAHRNAVFHHEGLVL